MIEIHLGRLLGERRMTMAELQRLTELDKNTISRLYHGKTQSISFNTLSRICHALKCTVGELLEHIADK
jgi:putative transcriptional regulator